MEKLIYAVLGVVGIVAVIGMILGVWWLVWSLWTWVLPQMWPTGPEAFIAPSYWLFVGAWVLLSLIGRALFKSGQ